ncbi:hypothetical protein GGS21DRAFT_531919 [Xylaria nigripes]|nr:hypothetical protein GGS21DRAFT_531919 [Xylaria nigripes]
MPIGDLLAEISGGQPSSAPSSKATALSGIKRKAEDASNDTSSKATRARQSDGSYSTSKVTRDREGRVVERSYSESRPVNTAGPNRADSVNSSTLPHRTAISSPMNGHNESSAPTNQRLAAPSSDKLSSASSGAAQSKRPSEASVRSKLNQNAPTINKGLPSKPSPSMPASSVPSRAPKKGSFKEIMARGAKAQEVMGKVGMIQHRSTDKSTSKKDREPTKPTQKSGTSSGPKGNVATSYTGTGRPSAMTGRDNGQVGASARTTSRNGPTKDVKTADKAKSNPAANDVAEKKAKKSATATTGYAGTARPRPGAAANKGTPSGGHRPGQGGLLAPPRMNRRSKYEDDYDEDLDDFIEYDEEDEDQGPRYGYDSDGSSDMEAGLSDIDSEEKRAEQYAREEDKREQILEEKLKKEKQERKQRWSRSGR